MGGIKRLPMYNLRIRYGMSQAELAAAARISTPTISLWERGKSDPSMFALQSVCDALGATLTEYVTGNTIDPPKTAQRGAEAATMKRKGKMLSIQGRGLRETPESLNSRYIRMKPGCVSRGYQQC